MAAEWEEYHAEVCNRWIWQNKSNGGYGEGLKKDVRALFMAHTRNVRVGVKVFLYDNYCEIRPKMWSIKFGILSWIHYKLDGSGILRRSICKTLFEEIWLIPAQPCGNKTWRGYQIRTCCSWTNYSRSRNFPKWNDAKTPFVIQTHSTRIVRMYLWWCWKTFVSQADKKSDVTILAFEAGELQILIIEQIAKTKKIS